MAVKVEIDPHSGFCAGVIRAIGTAEKYLARHPSGRLFSLGAIVHNEEELSRLEERGLVAIHYDDLDSISSAEGEALLIRAHGEPPMTYRRASALGFEIIDCTCPVVLQLQKEIRAAYERLHSGDVTGQLLIFGKIGHAEVLGLLGQVGGDALVIEDVEMLNSLEAEGRIRYDVPTEIFSQTTKSPAEYDELCSKINYRLSSNLVVHNSICLQVASRHQRLTLFARRHDVIIFVAGKASSNGAVLCELCKSVNIRTYRIGSVKDLKPEWIGEDDFVGVCGATSTPKWLLEEVARAIENFAN